MICLMQVPIDDRMGILDTVILPMRCLEHTGTRTGFFLPEVTKSILPFEIPSSGTIETIPFPFDSIGAQVYAELTQGGEA